MDLCKNALLYQHIELQHTLDLTIIKSLDACSASSLVKWGHFKGLLLLIPGILLGLGNKQDPPSDQLIRNSCPPAFCLKTATFQGVSLQNKYCDAESLSIC